MDGCLELLSSTAIVVIGRNEGDRLKRCLRSLPPGVPAVYVDSGSTDESVPFARSLGVKVLDLDMTVPFTAARARNAGWRELVSINPGLTFVQFIDGDCELNPNWLDCAVTSLAREPSLAAVFGRRRESFPDRSIYNKMCDDEWNTPIGLTESCGGDVLFRIAALDVAEGYSNSLIAGEEPDLCLRLRQMNWKVRRLDAEMTLHDAAITSFSPFWKRTERSGYAYAEHVWRHGREGIASWRRQLLSIVLWGLGLPLIALICLSIFVHLGSRLALFVSILCLAAYPLQIVRIAMRKAAANPDLRFASMYATLMVVGKFAQISGVLRCWWEHAFGSPQRLIEYKGH